MRCLLENLEKGERGWGSSPIAKLEDERNVHRGQTRANKSTQRSSQTQQRTASGGDGRRCGDDESMWWSQSCTTCLRFMVVSPEAGVNMRRKPVCFPCRLFAVVCSCLLHSAVCFSLPVSDCTPVRIFLFVLL